MCLKLFCAYLCGKVKVVCSCYVMYVCAVVLGYLMVLIGGGGWGLKCAPCLVESSRVSV